MRPIITLLSDFGTADGYVAEVKGTIMSRAPEAVLVDVAHDVAAHDIEAGRLAIARYWRKFPSGTVHFAVVDPGVGSTRRPWAVESDGRVLVGPDNGLLSPALLLAGAKVVELPVSPGAAPTFHGRLENHLWFTRVVAGVGRHGHQACYTGQRQGESLRQ